MNILGADADDTRRKCWFARSQHQWMQPVGNKIAEQPCAIRIILAPAEIMFGIEAAVFLHLAEPLFPINGVSFGIGIERDIPFTLLVITAVITLAPDQWADLTALDQLCGLTPTGSRATLRADLKDLAGFFDGIVHLEGLAKVASQRFLDINMFAGIERVHRNARVHGIVRGDDDGINVFAFEQ